MTPFQFTIAVFGEAFKAIRENMVRCILAVVGIGIGVFSVTAIMIVVLGFKTKLDNQLNTIAPNLIVVEYKQSIKDKLIGKMESLSFQDYIDISNDNLDISNLMATVHPVGFVGKISFEDRFHSTRVVGTGANYLSAYKSFPQYGRYFLEQDYAEKRRVAFLGATVASELNVGPENIGDFFLFNDEWFRLIGIGEEKGRLFGIDQDDYIHIPNNTLNSMIGDEYNSDTSISFSFNDSGNAQNIKSTIKTLISENHFSSPEFVKNVKFTDTKQSVKEFDSISSGVTYIALIIVSISIVVGAIGVTNTMMASYKERIREIGISKAIGATNTFIMWQYMVEGASLTLLGGAVGAVFGYMLGVGLTTVVPGLVTPQVNFLYLVLFTMAFIVLGLTVGYMPAKKASSLTPIEALDTH
ncbi:ABC transporter permease [Alteromonas stellipolaris]|uniref:ABC transporter permease n=1 Tax=Alteromonas stellipolaris TaxID=233316 RepID=A0ABM5YPS6_9ALTE|nr:hypothetical protein AVL57_00380 [Alteromonas stellipolaris]